MSTKLFDVPHYVGFHPDIQFEPYITGAKGFNFLTCTSGYHKPTIVLSNVLQHIMMDFHIHTQSKLGLYLEQSGLSKKNIGCHLKPR